MARNVLPQQTAIIASILTALAAGIGVYVYKKRKAPKVPTEWKAVGTVQKLCIYPLKSGRRIEIQKGECTKRGFIEMEKPNNLLRFRDRCFAVYNEAHHEYKGGRMYPKLVLIESEAHGEDSAIFKAPDMSPLVVKLPVLGKNKELIIKHVKNEEIHSLDCGEEAAVWISNFILGQDFGLRLAYYDERYTRNQIDKLYKPEIDFHKCPLSNESSGLFSDLSALHLINQKSILDMNRIMGSSEVNVDYFRPNLLIDGPDLEPYAEDKWVWMKAGDVIMRNALESTRCSFTTVEPEIGLRRKDRQPLKALDQYRMSKGPSKHPVMGLYVEVLRTGHISVGDIFYIGKT